MASLPLSLVSAAGANRTRKYIFRQGVGAVEELSNTIYRDSAPQSITADSIRMVSSSTDRIGIGPATAIDLTKYKKVCVTAKLNGLSNNLAFEIRTQSTGPENVVRDTLLRGLNKASVTTITTAIDVADLVGNYYMHVYAFNNNGGGYVYDWWLE